MQQQVEATSVLVHEHDAVLPAVPRTVYSRALCAYEICKAHDLGTLCTSDARLNELARQLLRNFGALLQSTNVQHDYAQISWRLKYQDKYDRICPLSNDLLPTVNSSDPQVLRQAAATFMKDGVPEFATKVRDRLAVLAGKLEEHSLAELEKSSREAILQAANYLCKHIMYQELPKALDEVRALKPFDVLVHVVGMLATNIPRVLPEGALVAKDATIGAVAAHGLLEFGALRLIDSPLRGGELLKQRLKQSLSTEAVATLDQTLSKPTSQEQVPALRTIVGDILERFSLPCGLNETVKLVVQEERTNAVRAWFLSRAYLSDMLAVDLILDADMHAENGPAAMRSAVSECLVSGKLSREILEIRKYIPKALDGDMLHVHLWEFKAPRLLEAIHLTQVRNVKVYGDTPCSFTLPEGEDYFCLARWYQSVKNPETRVKAVQLNQAIGSGAAIVEMEMRGISASYTRKDSLRENGSGSTEIVWEKQAQKGFYSFCPDRITYHQMNVPGEVVKLEGRCGTPMIWSTDKEGNLRYVISIGGRRDPDSTQFKLQRPSNWITIAVPVNQAIKLTPVECVAAPAPLPVCEAKPAESAPLVEAPSPLSFKNESVKIASAVDRVAQRVEAKKEETPQHHLQASHILEKEISELLAIWLLEARSLGVFGSALKEELPVLERGAQGKPLKAKEFRMLARFPDRLKGKHKVTYSNIAISAKIEELGEILGGLSTKSESMGD